MIIPETTVAVISRAGATAVARQVAKPSLVDTIVCN
jgi:hypothetical protein